MLGAGRNPLFFRHDLALPPSATTFHHPPRRTRGADPCQPIPARAHRAPRPGAADTACGVQFARRSVHGGLRLRPDALQALPGIGPALSKRIEAYRSSQHPFQHVDELTRVSGIGPKTLETLRPMVRVDAPADAAGPDADPES
ncbi:MAG: hypothetical protein BRD27_00045 [Bacteroidetes bacterium QH_10_64_19]|nr:MAG: hypothetical protein BRD27_00045 [Bacteroidetes bacterium QH_10_64_19]